MKKILIIGLLICLLLTGCTRGQYFLDGGVVNHDNSLQEAHDNCKISCEKYKHKGMPTPMIEECNSKECYCKC